MIFVAALLAPIAWKAGPPALRHTELLYWQRQAMRYSPPANEVIYYGLNPNSLPNVIAALQRPERKYRAQYMGDSVNDFYQVAEAWQRFYYLYSPPGRRLGATAFLHERRTPLGARRLVAVEVVPDFSTSGRPWAFHEFLDFSVSVVRPGTLASSPTELPNSTSIVDLGAFSDFSKSGIDLKIYAGQIDPEDASHFTINYWFQGNTGTIDGWLLDDDIVKLERRRSPPLTSLAPSSAAQSR